MAHTIFSATGPVDLLQQLVTQLVVRGWTSLMSQADGSGWRAHLSKGGVFLNFRAYVNELAPYTYTSGFGGYGLTFYTGTGFNSGANFQSQAGGPIQNGTSAPIGASIVLGAGPYPSVQFMDDGLDNYVVIVERTAGIYRHLGWGTLDKSDAGTWTGGKYFYGRNSGYASGTVHDAGASEDLMPLRAGNNENPSFIQANVDAWVDKWLSLSITTGQGYTGKRGSSSVDGLASGLLCPLYFWERLYSVMDARAVLMPVFGLAERDAGGVSLLGKLPMQRATAANLLGVAIGSDIQIGAETWRVFNGWAAKVVD